MVLNQVIPSSIDLQLVKPSYILKISWRTNAELLQRLQVPMCHEILVISTVYSSSTKFVWQNVRLSLFKAFLRAKGQKIPG